MKKYSTLLLFAGILFLNQCNPKPSTADSQSNLAASEKEKPNFGGYETAEDWGEHLVDIGGCNHCHTPKKMGPNGPVLNDSLLMSGRPAAMPKLDIDRKGLEKKGYAVTMDLTEWAGPWGVSYAANLTPDPTGIGNWTEKNFFVAIREGKSKGLSASRTLLPPMPWQDLGKMSDAEISAVFAYLKSLKPIANNVPAPLPPASAPMMK